MQEHPPGPRPVDAAAGFTSPADAPVVVEPVAVAGASDAPTVEGSGLPGDAAVARDSARRASLPTGDEPAVDGMAASDGMAAADGAATASGAGGGAGGCTLSQLRRFVKSRPYVPLHELRRRFALNGGEDDVVPLEAGGSRLYVGLPEREARLLEELLRHGEVGYECSLDPPSPIIVGVYPMRPVPRQ